MSDTPRTDEVYFDVDANIRRVWYEKAKAALNVHAASDWTRDVRMVEMLAADLASLYRAYVQLYETRPAGLAALMLEAAKALDDGAAGFSYPSQLADKLRAIASTPVPEGGLREVGTLHRGRLGIVYFRQKDQMMEFPLHTSITVYVKEEVSAPQNGSGNG